MPIRMKQESKSASSAFEIKRLEWAFTHHPYFSYVDEKFGGALRY